MISSFMRKCFGFIVSLFLFVSFDGIGQVKSDAERQYDPNSTLKIPEYEQLYRVRVKRRIDLREKQNKGFFAYGRELPKLIKDGLMSGEIDSIYDSDKLDNVLAIEDFNRSLEKTEGKAAVPYDAFVSYAYGEIVTYNGMKYSSIQEGNYGNQPDQNLDIYWAQDATAGQAITYEDSDIGVIILTEDVIFDKRRSTLYHDIIAITLVVPADRNDQFAMEFPVGTFKYNQLEKYFRNNPEKAKWVNRYNPKEWKNFADAFTLRLFSGPIIQYETPDDLPIEALMPNQYEAVMEIHRYEMQLMEKEHNLWEY